MAYIWFIMACFRDFVHPYSIDFCVQYGYRITTVHRRPFMTWTFFKPGDQITWEKPHSPFAQVAGPGPFTVTRVFQTPLEEISETSGEHMDVIHPQLIEFLIDGKEASCLGDSLALA